MMWIDEIDPRQAMREALQARIDQTYIDQRGIERALANATQALEDIQSERLRLQLELEGLEQADNPNRYTHDSGSEPPCTCYGPPIPSHWDKCPAAPWNAPGRELGGLEQ